MSLRVLHVSAYSPKLVPIRAGRICFISQSNESDALASLEHICRLARSRAVDGLRRIRETRSRYAHRTNRDIGSLRTHGGAKPGGNPIRNESVMGAPSLEDWVWQGLDGLWEEELEVVSAVLRRIEKGQTDW
jgi:hypothetical protein